MIKVYQDKFVDIDGTGNCVAACLASLLELPLRDLPDILPTNTDNFWGKWNGWLRTRGKRLRFLHPKENYPQGYHLASVKTERVYPPDHKEAGEQIHHMVVCFSGEIIHDPHPFNKGQYEILYYWSLEDRERE